MYSILGKIALMNKSSSSICFQYASVKLDNVEERDNNLKSNSKVGLSGEVSLTSTYSGCIDGIKYELNDGRQIPFLSTADFCNWHNLNNCWKLDLCSRLDVVSTFSSRLQVGICNWRVKFATICVAGHCSRYSRIERALICRPNI